MYNFGKTSLEKLETCHHDLQNIMKEAIRISNVDFGIAEGYRDTIRQKQLFDEGKSKIDGITQKGKHNQRPSMAVDIYAFINNKASWDNESLSYLAGIIHTVAGYLYEQGSIIHKVRWGGNWNMDGVILLDQTFDDRPHFELVMEN